MKIPLEAATTAIVLSKLNVNQLIPDKPTLKLSFQ